VGKQPLLLSESEKRIIRSPGDELRRQEKAIGSKRQLRWDSVPMRRQRTASREAAKPERSKKSWLRTSFLGS
jgi:hypothetical protein